MQLSVKYETVLNMTTAKALGLDVPTSILGIPQRKKTGSPTAAMGHVWTAPAVQEESDYQRSVRVRSCIRPLSAAVWPLALM